MNDKIVILGARSGTSLMLNLLAATGKFRIWSNGTGRGLYEGMAQEIPAKQKQRILQLYPDQHAIADTFPDDWTLAKTPTFYFCIPALIKKFHPKFIVMDRSLEGRVHSMLNTRSGDSWTVISRKIFSNFPNICLPLTHGIESFNDEQWERRFTMGQDILLELELQDYDQSKILRVDFCEFMHDFSETMLKVSGFLGIAPGNFPLTWKSMRSKSYMNASHDPGYWVDGEIP